MANWGILKLRNSFQNYPWGSPRAIPDLLGFSNPTGAPLAEMWMGAHPKAPSQTDFGPLDKLIHDHPGEFLGSGPAGAGRTLPFLFKILAAAEPLSIQAHPSLAQAREGFCRENQKGVPLDAPDRNYRDANHKPEILCALTPFTALWGFRAADAIKKDIALAEGPGRVLLEALDGREASSGEEGKDSGEPAALRRFFETLLKMSSGETAALAEKLTGAVTEGPAGERFSWVKRLAEKYPGDPGVLAPVFLNLVSLEPGEAIFIPAGELHAYLEGCGLELMANSDNVLRGGLTPKHIDVPELLRVLRFQRRSPEKLSPRPVPGGAVYSAPVKEFFLEKLNVSPEGTAGPSGPGILLCLAGRGKIRENVPGDFSAEVSGDGGRDFFRGDSFFVPASAGVYRIAGEGELWFAGLPVPKDEA